MTGCVHFRQMVKCVILWVIVSLFVLSYPIKTFALNYDLIESEFNGWANVEDVILYDEEDFNGSLKKIVDSENSCVYIYFQITDKRIDIMPIENIQFNFKIKNSENSYDFSINNNGFINIGNDEKKSIKLAQNITKRGTYVYGFIGFELTQRVDKGLDSIILCSYVSGVNDEHILFENVKLNSSCNNVVSHEDIGKSQSKISTKKVIKKTSKSKLKTTDSTHTKFKGSHKYCTSKVIKNSTLNESNSIIEFNAGNDNTLDNSLDNTLNTQEKTSSENLDYVVKRSTADKAIKSAAMGIGLIGGVLVIYGTVNNIRILNSKKRNTINEDKDEKTE